MIEFLHILLSVINFLYNLLTKVVVQTLTLGVLLPKNRKMPFNPALKMLTWSSSQRVWEEGQEQELHPWLPGFATIWEF